MLQLMEVMGGVGGGRRGSRLLCYSAVFAVVIRWRERSVRVNLREWFFGYFIRPIISSVSISSTFQLWKI